jgi:hemolysin activation/secretion protein
MTALLRCNIGVALAALASLAAGQAAAQSVPHPALPPPGSPLPGIAPAQPGEVAPATLPPPPVAPTAVTGGQRFTIKSAELIGATAYSQAELAHVLDGLTGPAVPLERIEAARAALLTRYRQDGYTYTTVRVRIHGDTLRVTVTEPHIVAVRLSQDIGPAGLRVLAFLNHLADGQLLRQQELERWVLLANDVPGVTVRAVLDPAANDPGAITLRAIVERQAVNGTLRADNRAFRQTGPNELLAVADFNSFTSLGDRSEITLYHTTNDTNTFGQASEEFFLGDSGLKLRIYGGAGESTPSDNLRALGYDGVTRIFGAALSYPYIRSRQHNLTFAAQFDGVESDIAYDVFGHASRASFDSLRILRGNATDVLSDIWLGPAFGATNNTSVTVSQGLPAFGAVGNDSTTLPRAHERVDFTKATVQFDRLQYLFSPYIYNGTASAVNIDLGLAGQYSNNILPPEEKFYLGGPDFNSGFYYGQVTGDRAATGRFEPQLVTALPTLPRTSIVPQATFYTFADWGEVWENQKTDQGHTLRSLGLGVKLALGDHVDIDLEGVSRLTRTPDGPPPAGPRLKTDAIYWQVVGKF